MTPEQAFGKKVEQKIAQLLGDKDVAILALRAQLEAAQAEIARLKAAQVEPPKAQDG